VNASRFSSLLQPLKALAREVPLLRHDAFISNHKPVIAGLDCLVRGHTRHLFGDMADTLLVGPTRSARGVSKDSLRTKIARCSRRPGRARVRRALNRRRTASPQKAESWRRAKSLPAKWRQAAERKLRRHLNANLVVDYTSRCCYLSFSLAHEGAFLETILRRSEAWRPAAAACNRRPGRHGTPPAGHYDPDARSSL